MIKDKTVERHLKASPPFYFYRLLSIQRSKPVDEIYRKAYQKNRIGLMQQSDHNIYIG